MNQTEKWHTFKKKYTKKKNPVVALIIIVIIALVMVALNWVLLDFTSSLYEEAGVTQETVTTQNQK